MELSKFLIMRTELSLIALILILLVIEIFADKNSRQKIFTIATSLFALHTILGFMPATFGSLFGEMYQSSALTSVMKSILNVSVLIVLLQSSSWLKQKNNENKLSEYFMLMLSTLLGMYYMISAGDFLMLYLGLELATIPMAALAAFDIFKMKSTEAGVKLILLAAMSSGIMLFGISVLYAAEGSVFFHSLATSISLGSLQVMALMFIVSGLAFKISIVPFHFWTADVYEGAPTNVAAYLSVVSKGASVFVLATLLFTVFKNIIDVWQPIIYGLAIITMTIGNLFALRQKNIQRFLAFSSVAQAGFILLGIINGGDLGMTTVVYFILVYAFSNLGAFGVVSIVKYSKEKILISDYDGFYDTNPKLSMVMLLSLFSLAGIPPVAGFFGKFFLFTAAAEQGYYILVLIAVLNTIISLYYYLIVVKAMFINKSETPIATISTDAPAKLALVLCMAGVAVAGIFSHFYEWVEVVVK